MERTEHTGVVSVWKKRVCSFVVIDRILVKRYLKTANINLLKNVTFLKNGCTWFVVLSVLSAEMLLSKTV